MRKKYEKKVLSRIFDYVVATYKKINQDSFILGDCMYNYKCHINSIQRVKNGSAQKVYVCIAVKKTDWQTIIVHFINQLENGEFQDNTWGWVYEDYDYYIVKELDVSEMKNSALGEVFNGTKESLVSANSNTILRKIFGIKASDLI